MHIQEILVQLSSHLCTEMPEGIWDVWFMCILEMQRYTVKTYRYIARYKVESRQWSMLFFNVVFLRETSELIFL